MAKLCESEIADKFAKMCEDLNINSCKEKKALHVALHTPPRCFASPLSSLDVREDGMVTFEGAPVGHLDHLPSGDLCFTGLADCKPQKLSETDQGVLRGWMKKINDAGVDIYCMAQSAKYCLRPTSMYVPPIEAHTVVKLLNHVFDEKEVPKDCLFATVLAELEVLTELEPLAARP